MRDRLLDGRRAVQDGLRADLAGRCFSGTLIGFYDVLAAFAVSIAILIN